MAVEIDPWAFDPTVGPPDSLRAVKIAGYVNVTPDLLRWWFDLHDDRPDFGPGRAELAAVLRRRNVGRMAKRRRAR